MGQSVENISSGDDSWTIIVIPMTCMLITGVFWDTGGSFGRGIFRLIIVGFISVFVSWLVNKLIMSRSVKNTIVIVTAVACFLFLFYHLYSLGEAKIKTNAALAMEMTDNVVDGGDDLHLTVTHYLKQMATFGHPIKPFDARPFTGDVHQAVFQDIANRLSDKASPDDYSLMRNAIYGLAQRALNGDQPGVNSPDNPGAWRKSSAIAGAVGGVLAPFGGGTVAAEAGSPRWTTQPYGITGWLRKHSANHAADRAAEAFKKGQPFRVSAWQHPLEALALSGAQGRSLMAQRIGDLAVRDQVVRRSLEKRFRNMATNPTASIQDVIPQFAGIGN